MPHSHDGSVLMRALDWIKARIARDNELALLSSADMHYLAADIGISEADFRALAPKIADHSELMDQMMLARGIDPEMARTSFAALVRDMEVSCALCPTPSMCRKRLENGTAAETAHQFCPNAEIMDTLPGAHL
ncbi:MAG: DUF6455 family protein [Acetobacteraceae bacterium]|nr:hypothetical protein [Pseudomonadota bacterium]